MSNSVSRQEAVKGLVVMSSKGEVVLQENVAGKGYKFVRVTAFRASGEPYTTMVPVRSLRWF